MPRRIALLSLCLGLLVLLLLPATALAGDDERSPGRTADWWLWGDLALKEQAAAIVAKASPGYLKRFQEALVQRQQDPVSAADRLIQRAMANDPEAETLLLGMGPLGVRRLLDRIRATDTHVLDFGSPPLGIATPVVPAPARQVLVTTQVYTLERGGAAGLLGSARGDGIHLLEDLEVKMLQRTLEQSPGAVRLNHPRLLVEDMHWATMQITDPVPYVKDYRARQKGDTVVADPVIETLHEGMFLEMRPVVSTDGRHITLEGYVAHRTVRRPIPVKEIVVQGLATAEPLEIQTPTLAESRLDLHVTLPGGGWALGAGLVHTGDEKQELLVLVKAELADPAAFGATAVAAAAAEPRFAISVEVKALAVSEAALQRALGHRIPNADRPTLTLDAAQVLALLGTDRQGAEGVTIVHAPRLTAYDGQKANVNVVNQVSFVQDYDLETAPDGSQMADPIIGVLQEGLVLELRPHVSKDRKAIRLDARVTWADLSRPIPEFTTKIGTPPQEVTIQLPELAVRRVKDDCRMAPGGWILLGGLGGQGPNRRFLLLHATVVDLDDAPGDGR